MEKQVARFPAARSFLAVLHADGFRLASDADAADVVEAIKTSHQRGALMWRRGERPRSTIPRFQRVLENLIKMR